MSSSMWSLTKASKSRYLGPFACFVVVAALMMYFAHGSDRSPSGFSLSPWRSSGVNSSSSLQPLILFATLSPVEGVQRRETIRRTWQTLYRRDTRALLKFVVGEPPNPNVEAFLRLENQTYGDIILLPGVPENYQNGNTIKPFRLYSLLVDNNLHRANYVAEVDDDSFVLVPRFIDKYILPNLDRQRVMIARDPRPIYDPGFLYPGGNFCAMSWDLMERIVVLDRTHPDVEFEDIRLGRLLHDAEEPFEFIDIPNSECFDLKYGETDKEAWSHDVCRESIAPHKMKKEEDYEYVASFFDEQGMREELAVC